VRNVAHGPSRQFTAIICPTAKELFDNLVGATEHRKREGDGKRLGDLEVDGNLVLSWRPHRQVTRLLALEDAIDEVSRAVIRIN
jgi:hypothetical protein